jgi:collagen type VII alpha
MSVQISKDITTVQVEIPKTNVAVENAVTNINVQTSQPLVTISQAGVSGKDGTSGTSGTFGNVLSSSLKISGSIIPNVADGDLTSSFSLGSATNAWKDLWISKGTIYFIGDNNESASISINADNQIVISDINLAGSLTASLREGYIWVGGPGNKNIAIPTSSLVTGGTGAGFPYEGEAQITGSLIVTGSIFLNGVNIAGGGIGTNGTSGTSGLTITGSAGSDGTSGTSGLTITGSAGTSGIDGTSGTSGLTITGSAGSHGTSGTSGISVLVDSGSFATIGSNSFNGNQTITGSLIQGLEGNIATGENSHAEGSITKAIGNYSHAEGDNTQAKGDYSHAEGQETIASGSYSHAEGYQTIALANHQHVQGQYNAVSSVPSAFIVGNGTDDINRSNLIHAAGNEVEITGSLNINGSFTSSLAEGYVWVGGINDITHLVATSSFAITGSNTFIGNQTISGSVYLQNGESILSADKFDSPAGDLTLRAGDSVTSDAGDLTVRAGDTVTGIGGNLIISAGDTTTGNAGTLNISSGETITGNGGNFTINAGQTISGDGGDVSINALRIVSASVNKDWVFGSASVIFPDGTTQLTAFTGIPQGTVSSSQQITDFGFVSSSTADTTALNNFTSSIIAEINAIEAYTASLKATTLISGAAQITALGFGAGGGDVTALNTYTGSQSAITNIILQTTASLKTYTSSISGITNAIMAYTASLKATTLISSSGQISGFATLTANTFVGNQIITGSLIVSSTAVSDATLLTSSSNLILNSGSNLYINNGGLAQISGSLNVTGSATINDILILTPRTTNPTNPISGSFIVSSSGDTIKPFFWDGNDWQALY